MLFNFQRWWCAFSVRYTGKRINDRSLFKYIHRIPLFFSALRLLECRLWSVRVYVCARISKQMKMNAKIIVIYYLDGFFAASLMCLFYHFIFSVLNLFNRECYCVIHRLHFMEFCFSRWKKKHNCVPWMV